MFRCKLEGCFWENIGLMKSLKGLAIFEIIKSINALKKKGDHDKVTKILENIDTHSCCGLYQVNVLFKRILHDNKYYFYYKSKSRITLRNLKKYLKLKNNFDFVLTESTMPYFCYCHAERPVTFPPLMSPAYPFSRQDIAKELYKGELFNKIHEKHGELMIFSRVKSDKYLKSLGKSKIHKLFVIGSNDASFEICDVNPTEIYYNELLIVPWDIINMS